MSSLAQEESRSISENVTWGQRKRFADGKVSMPYRHFLGYRKGADGLPEIVPEEAELVRRISSKDLYAVYCTWCDENAYPPMKRKTFVEYLSAHEEKLDIRYTTHLTNSAGREVRGFRGIDSIISPPGYMQGGWQKVDPDENPFKDA